MQTLNPNRIIEINNLGRFYVTGKPEYAVYTLSSGDGSITGWIIVEDLDDSNQNRVYKLNADDQPVAKLLSKSLEMAEEICFACNRLRL
jgi:hypothetical protein